MEHNKIYGVHAVEALLQEHAKQIEVLWVEKKASNGRLKHLTDAATAQQIPVRQATSTMLDEHAKGQRHQGVMALCAPQAPWSEKEFLHRAKQQLAEQPMFLVLDGVQDPHNLGACMRSAEASGVSAILIPKDHSASLSPVVHKVSCGASWRVPLVSVANLSRVLKNLQDLGYWTVGLDQAADVSIYELDYASPMVMIMGAEHQGIRRLTRKHCDFLAQIPMAGQVESLNVSVATGVCLFEALRQRSASK